MRKITMIIASVVAVLGIALMPMPTYAVKTCDNVTGTYLAACSACLADANADWDDANNKCVGKNSDMNGIIQTVINIMLFIVGILSVIMIIFGGIRYVTSTGDKGKVDSAKNTILYAIVGLVVAIVAFAVVQWVFNTLVK
jgi:hypothetical protein